MQDAPAASLIIVADILGDEPRISTSCRNILPRLSRKHVVNGAAWCSICR